MAVRVIMSYVNSARGTKHVSGNMTSRSASFLLAALVLSGCGNREAQATQRRRAVGPRSLIGPARTVRVRAVPAEAAVVFHRNGFVFVMDGAGGNDTQITFDEPRVWEHVAISLDRRFIAANEQLPNPTGEAGGLSRLWIFDLQVATVAQLLPHFATAGNGGVDWDRHGFIYFAAKERNRIENPKTPADFRANAGANDIYRIRYDATGLQRLLNTPMAGEADVSIAEDESMIAYVSQPLDVAVPRTEIWVMSSDGSGSRVVFVAGEVGVASAHDPETSPDNTKIVFSIVNSSVPPNFPQNPAANTAHDIWQMNLDGSGARRLTRPGPISITADWKGNSILYLEISEAERYAGISVVRPGQTEQVQIRIKADANIAKWIP